MAGSWPREQVKAEAARLKAVSAGNVPDVWRTRKHDSEKGAIINRADLATVRDAMKLALEEIDRTIEMARQRAHMPTGLQAYRADVADVLARIT